MVRNGRIQSHSLRHWADKTGIWHPFAFLIPSVTMDELQNWTVPARTLQGARKGFGLLLNSVGQYEGYIKRVRKVEETNLLDWSIFSYVSGWSRFAFVQNQLNCNALQNYNEINFFCFVFLTIQCSLTLMSIAKLHITQAFCHLN